MIVLISGASSGFGALTSRALVDAGHIVYAGMRDLAGRNATAAAEATAYSERLRPVELDVSSETSVQQAVDTVVGEQGRIDVLIHNAGHMVTGPAEAFTPEQVLDLYDTNVVGTQRLNRAALPVMRAQQDGLVVWVGSSSTRGGTPPYLGPYFAAKAGMDALAQSYALELARFGIETTIVVPGAFTHGTNHFLHSGSPADTDVVAAYETKYAGLMEQVGQRLAEIEPEWSDVGEVARLIASVVDMEKGTRPFRASYDPSDDGAIVVNAVADRVRAQLLHRIGLEDLLHPVA
ncbi:SDR family oxidoreductase [Kribbella sp. NBC_01505]|uniref:SDR family oxidoreductase n=1 Tax=Kribbella sp. NBC_01505 TaxID=2903580 RepID=UPI0038642FDA